MHCIYRFLEDGMIVFGFLFAETNTFMRGFMRGYRQGGTLTTGGTTAAVRSTQTAGTAKSQATTLNADVFSKAAPEAAAPTNSEESKSAKNHHHDAENIEVEASLGDSNASSNPSSGLSARDDSSPSGSSSASVNSDRLVI